MSPICKFCGFLLFSDQNFDCNMEAKILVRKIVRRRVHGFDYIVSYDSYCCPILWLTSFLRRLFPRKKRIFCRLSKPIRFGIILKNFWGDEHLHLRVSLEHANGDCVKRCHRHMENEANYSQNCGIMMADYVHYRRHNWIETNIETVRRTEKAFMVVCGNSCYRRKEREMLRLNFELTEM